MKRFRAEVTISTETAEDFAGPVPPPPVLPAIHNVMGDLLRGLADGPKTVATLRWERVPVLLLRIAESMHFVERNASQAYELTEAGRHALASGRFDVGGGS